MENNNTENYNTTAINNNNFLDLADVNNNNNKLNDNNYTVIKAQQLQAIKKWTVAELEADPREALYLTQERFARGFEFSRGGI